MKKLLTIAFISAAALGLTMTAANAKCNGDSKTKTEKPADDNGTKGKCGQGKCGGK